MAKPWSTYLTENDNDAERAGRAAAADVQQREDQNKSARAFQRAYKPVLESLKLPVENLGDEAAVTEQAQRLLGDLQAAGPKAEALAAALKEVGADPADLRSVKTVKDRLSLADKAVALERTQALRDAADALGYDHAKLSRLRGVDDLTQREVEVAAEDGTTTKQLVWGVPGKNEQGADTFTTLQDFTSPFAASLTREATPQAPQPSVPATGPQFVQQRPTPAAPTVTVGDRSAEIRAEGRGTI